MALGLRDARDSPLPWTSTSPTTSSRCATALGTCSTTSPRPSRVRAHTGRRPRLRPGAVAGDVRAGLDRHRGARGARRRRSRHRRGGGARRGARAARGSGPARPRAARRRRARSRGRRRVVRTDRRGRRAGVRRVGPAPPRSLRAVGGRRDRARRRDRVRGRTRRAPRSAARDGPDARARMVAVRRDPCPRDRRCRRGSPPARPWCRAHGRRPARQRVAGARHGGRVRERPCAVRSADRVVPGGEAPLRRHAGRRGGHAVDGLLGCVVPGSGRRGGVDRGLHREDVVRGRLEARHVVRAAGARRDRLHLGARSPLLLEARTARPGRLRDAAFHRARLARLLRPRVEAGESVV
ncbi:MAG: hypothetical protein KatS3mg010_1001 [Acidimicrobiia bacterium]|nr:MAG: hypothetical protein KatS3mg010_1001 [Acidimicrobiia bacterium]